MESFVYHPSYKGILGDSQTNRFIEEAFHDVAVITFSGQLPAGFYPVTIGDSAKEVGTKTSAIVAGYGAYSQNDNNLRPLTAVETQIDEVLNEFKEIQLEVNGKGACYGDSGGPTFVFPADRACLQASWKYDRSWT